MTKIYTLLFGLMTFTCLQDIYATMQWSGSSMPDVLDENLIIEGDCQTPLDADVYVRAHNTDVIITLARDATIRVNNSNDDNLSTMHHGIVLEVIYPYSITIVVSHKLNFKGATGFPSQPIEVRLQGNGNIQWVFEDDSDAKVRFVSDENSGGAELWTMFSTVLPLSSRTTPNNSFEIKRNGQVQFGHRSKWGYRVFDSYYLNTQTIFEHQENSEVGFGDFSGFSLEIVTF
jgi:hypothetical protein